MVDVEERHEASLAAATSDHVVLVGSPATEPALAAVLAESLRRIGPDPIIVLNRAGPDPERWADRGALEIPDSRMGAQLALAGREPRGGLGRAVEELVTRCEYAT